MHQEQPGATFSDHCRQARIKLQTADVVHELGAGRQRFSRHGRFAGVDRHRDVGRLANHPDRRKHPGDLFFDADRLRAGPGALTADIDQIDPFGDHGVDAGLQSPVRGVSPPVVK